MQVVILRGLPESFTGSNTLSDSWVWVWVWDNGYGVSDSDGMKYDIRAI